MPTTEQPLWALKTLGRGSPPVSCLSASPNDLILVGESGIWRLQPDQNGAMVSIRENDLFGFALGAVFIASRLDPIAVLLESGRITFFDMDLKPKSSISLPNSSPYNCPSRLMAATADGSFIAVASFETDLWIIPSTNPFYSIKLESVVMSMAFVNFTRLVLFLSSEAGPHRIAIVTLSGQSATIHYPTCSPSWSGDVVACSSIPSHPSFIVAFDEAKAVLFDVDHLRIVSVKEVPSWQRGREHRIQDSHPLVSALNICCQRLLIVFESGYLYQVVIHHSGHLDLIRLGLINPASMFASVMLPSSTFDRLSKNANRMHVATNIPIPLIVAFGEHYDGSSIAVLDWEPSSDHDSIAQLQIFPSLNPIFDAELVNGKLLACSGSGKHGRILSLNYGIAFKFASSPSLSGFLGLQAIFPLNCAVKQPMLMLSFVGGSRLLGSSLTDDQYLINDVTSDWDIRQDLSTVAASFIDDKFLCQVHVNGIRITRRLQPGSAHGVVADWVSSSPIVSGSIIKNHILIATDRSCYLLVIDLLSFSIQVQSSRTDFTSDITAVKLLEESNFSRTTLWSVICHSNGAAQITTSESGSFRTFTVLFEGDEEDGSCSAVESIAFLQNNVVNLLLSRRDGTIARFFVSSSFFSDMLSSKTQFKFAAPQILPIGVMPVSLVPIIEHCGASDRYSLLALAENSVLIQCRGDSLQLKPIRNCFKDASSYITHAAGFAPGVLAVVSDQHLSFIEFDRPLDPNSMMHICADSNSVIELGRTPRRIVHDPSSAYTVCACTDLVDGTLKSLLFLIDTYSGSKTTFGSLGSLESVQSLYVWLSADHGALVCVGTSNALCNPSAISSDSGRLICYKLSKIYSGDLKSSPNQQKKLISSPVTLVCEASFRAAVLSIAAINKDRLAVAAADYVHVLSIIDGKLRNLCSFEAQDLIVHLNCHEILATNGENEYVGEIAVCGSAGHLQMLQYHSNPIDVIKNAPTDRNSRASIRTAFYANTACLVADKFGSIFAVNASRSRWYLETRAFLHLGETVSKMIDITRDKEKQFLLCTLSGSVYKATLLSNATQQGSQLLLRLQSLILDRFEIPLSYRAAQKLLCFVDVDLMLRFLDLPIDQQERIVEEADSEYSVPTVLALLDELSRHGF